MDDEVIIEDTPDDNGVEMLEHKLILLKAVNQNLNAELEMFKTRINHYRLKCGDYEKQIELLVNNMTVGQLKASGVHVTITIPTHEDEDYD
jgi:uncharacterized protein YlxW (UPF0749 family)